MPDPYAEFDALIQAGQSAVAERQLFDWIKDHPDDARAWVLLGRSVENPTRKRDCFKRALALDTGNPEAKELLRQLEPVAPAPGSRGGQAAAEQRGKPARVQRIPGTATPAGHLSQPSKARNSAIGSKLSIFAFSLFHLVFTFLLGGGLVLLMMALVPGLLPSTNSNANVQRSWLSSTDTSAATDAQRGLAAIFLNPAQITYVDAANLDALRPLRSKLPADTATAAPVQLAGARIVGKLVGGNVVQAGKEGQPVVVAMQVEFDGIRMPVVYYGPTVNFHYGDTLTVEGVYIDDPNGIAAQRVRQIATTAAVQPDAASLLQIRLGGLVLLWALLCASILSWRLNLRRWTRAHATLVSPAALLLALLPFTIFLAGCSIDLSTSLSSDGTGVTTITAQETRENMNFLRSVPGVSGYMSAIIRDIKGSGAMFEQYVQGDQEFMVLQRYGGGGSGETGDTYPLKGSWTSVQRYTEGNEDVTRFLGVVDTRSLYADTGTLDPEVANALRDQLNQISMTYHLSVPGQIVYQNGDTTTNQQVSWQLAMNNINYLAAETRLPARNKSVAGASGRYVWAALGTIFLISTLLLMASFRIRLSAANTARQA